MSGDQITISLDLFTRLQAQVRDLQADNARLAQEAKEAALQDLPADLAEKIGAARVSLLADTIRAQFEIVAFAVANLHPLTVRGWPYPRLFELSEVIPKLGGILPPEQSVTFLLFGEKCQKWEEARAKGVEQELLAEENAAKAISVEAAKRYGLGVGIAADFSAPLLGTRSPQSMEPMPPTPTGTTPDESTTADADPTASSPG